MTSFLFLWLLLFGAGGSAPAAFPDTAFLPPDGFLQTWKKSGNIRVFTASDLYGYIDGGAEIFLEFGFEQLTVQHYKPDFQPGAAKNAADEFAVEIYRMADPVAATGMYLMNCGRESPDASFAERHTLNQFQLLFKRHRYYVMVNNAEGNDKLRAGMLEFGRYLAARMPAETPVKLHELLPAKGLDKNSVRLIRGPYALQSVFTLGNGDILQLGRKLTAVSGSYQDASGKYSLILADYPNSQAAQKAFLNVQNNLDTYLKIQEKNDRRLIFKDYNNEYGVVSLAGQQLTIQVHLAKKPSLQGISKQ
jgi:hypothetical protein